ncbi:MAG: hypothetical protein RLZZ360_564 [Candidatus Parcubacteria bacterium]|jgi:flagellar basal body-associated protein FliL
MSPELPIYNQSNQESKTMRTLIVVGLALLLVTLLFGYIYYGMRLASTTNQVAEPITEVDATPEVDPIIKALEGAPMASDEEFAQVVDALETVDDANIVDATVILDSLPQ